ncbi:hypothetical protein EDB89DRAFT_2133741 [Lactarius sanguifluus]|nr:hypothetical protein EDB89DRAFT_2133741 [Lactarius sanguifluus]
MVFTLAYAIFDDFAKHLTQLPFSAIGYLWTILKFECRLRKSLPTLWGLASRHAPEPDVLKRWRETIENQVKTRRQWFSQGMRKSVKLCAYTADSTVVTSALEWTLTALDEDKEIEDFAARVPGFFDSRVVPDATLSVLPLMSHRPNANPIFGSRLYDLLKTCISETSPLDDKMRKNRLRVCMKYLWHFGQKYNELGPSQVLPSYFPDALASPGITRRIWLYGGDNVMSSLLASAVFASLPVGRPGTYRLHLPLHAVVVWTGTGQTQPHCGGCAAVSITCPLRFSTLLGTSFVSFEVARCGIARRRTVTSAPPYLRVAHKLRATVTCQCSTYQDKTDFLFRDSGMLLSVRFPECSYAASFVLVNVATTPTIIHNGMIISPMQEELMSAQKMSSYGNCTHTSCVTQALVLGAEFHHIFEGNAPCTPMTCHDEAMWMVWECPNGREQAQPKDSSTARRLWLYPNDAAQEVPSGGPTSYLERPPSPQTQVAESLRAHPKTSFASLENGLEEVNSVSNHMPWDLAQRSALAFVLTAPILPLHWAQSHANLAVVWTKAVFLLRHEACTRNGASNSRLLEVEHVGNGVRKLRCDCSLTGDQEVEGAPDATRGANNTGSKAQRKGLDSLKYMVLCWCRDHGCKGATVDYVRLSLHGSVNTSIVSHEK